LKEYPHVFDDFKDILKDPISAENLIKPTLLKEFIGNLKQNPNSEDIEMKVEIINQYDSSKGLTNILLKQYIEKIVGFLADNNLTTDTFWMKQLTPLLKKVKEQTVKTDIFNILNQKYNFLWQQYNSQWDQEAYQECLYNFLTVANEYYIL